ncbi:MAG: phosphoribosylformylglycinamidine synthase I [Planctomycetota bacterium]
MSAPKALILRAPGINCERETAQAFRLAGACPELVHVSELVARRRTLDEFRILAFPGGFAYGDDIASGKVLAQELKHHLGDDLVRFLDRGGLCLGICNGFQVMVRLGILPGTTGRLEQEVTLTGNLSNHYECRWVEMASLPSRCVFLPPGLKLSWPAAHGEGRLLARDERAARTLLDEGFVPLVYVDERGQATERYPANPNGSPFGIAGLTNASGRALGMMPHPDRAYLPLHMPDWRRMLREQGTLPEHGCGMVVFAEMVKVARAEG